MAITASDPNFNIEFNFENNTSKFVIDDNTSYPADGIDYYWMVKIESPSGVIYETPNFTNAVVDYGAGSPGDVCEGTEGGTFDSSVAAPAGFIAKTAFTIPVDANGNVELGTYTVALRVMQDDSPNTNLIPPSGAYDGIKAYTITYDATYAAPTGVVTMAYDLLTATVTAQDATSYGILNTTPTTSRVTSITYPKPSGFVTGNSATTSVSVSFPNTYTGTYTGAVATTATYDFSANYTVVYEINGTKGLTVDDSNSITSAYSGLNTALANVASFKAAGRTAEANAEQVKATEINNQLEAGYGAITAGDSTGATTYYEAAISIANLSSTSTTSSGTVQLIPVAQASASDSVDVTGNAARGTEVIKTAAASGTSFKVQLTSTANTKLNDAVTDNDVDYTAARFRTESIPESRGTTVESLGTGGGTKNLTPIASSRDYVYTGSGTLSSSWTIQIDPGITASDLVDGDSLRVLYQATFTPDGNNVTLFGTALTDDQIASGKILAITTYDVGTTTWYTQIVDGANIQRTYDSSGNEILDTSSGNTILNGIQPNGSSPSALVRESNGQIKSRTDFATSANIVDPTYYRGLGLPQNGFKTASTTVPTSGTKTLTSGTDDHYQIFTGTTTLAGNYTVASGGTPIDGEEWWIDWRSATTIGGFTLTIFGQSINATLALEGFLMLAKYDADTAAYRLTILPDLLKDPVIDTGNIVDDAITSAKIAPSAIVSGDVSISAITTAKLANDAVTEDKIAAGAVTPTELSSTAATDIVVCQGSFETSEVGDMKIQFPYACTVTKIVYSVTKLIEATDDASVDAKDNASTSMGVTTITMGTAIGTSFTESPTTNNTLAAGETMTFTTAKSTAGGKVQISVHVTRT